VLAREVLVSRGTLALLAVVVGLDLVARTLLPLGIATSSNHVAELGLELRLVLFATLALLTQLRMARWRIALPGIHFVEPIAIVIISGLYLHLLLGCVVVLPARLLFRESVGISFGAVGESLWLSSLAGILTLGRHAPRTLGLAFLLLAWWVPILGRLPPTEPLALASGISQPAWSAGGILPMLVPHLLAVAYVSLDRVQR